MSVADQTVDYAPIVGTAKAFQTKRRDSNGIIQTKSIEDRKVTLYKSLVGTVAMASMFNLASEAEKDGGEEPWIAFYGKGPRKTDGTVDFSRLTGQAQQRWKPWSVRIGGSFISLKDITFAMAPLALVGDYFDRRRWDKKFDEKSELESLMLSTLAMKDIIFSTSGAAGLAEMTDAIFLSLIHI